MITLETKGLTEVYGVRTELLTPILAEELQSYVTQKETSEIERIATMIRFFELDRCLNYNLARYFGDQQAPEHCGHCSVCRGNVLSLDKSSSYQVVDSLSSDMQTAKLWLLQKLPQNQVTPVLLARFMAGLTQPVFTKLKARQQPSFAKYEDVAYSTLLNQAENL